MARVSYGERWAFRWADGTVEVENASCNKTRMRQTYSQCNGEIIRVEILAAEVKPKTRKAKARNV